LDWSLSSISWFRREKWKRSIRNGPDHFLFRSGQE
jgi:hypothetical protein